MALTSFIGTDLLVYEWIHVVHSLGAVVRHNRVEEFSDELGALLGVRGGLLRPVGLVEDLGEDHAGEVQRPDAVQRQDKMIYAGSQLMDVGIFPRFGLPGGLMVCAVAEHVER